MYTMPPPPPLYHQALATTTTTTTYLHVAYMSMGETCRLIPLTCSPTWLIAHKLGTSATDGIIARLTPISQD